MTAKVGQLEARLMMGIEEARGQEEREELEQENWYERESRESVYWKRNDSGIRERERERAVFSTHSTGRGTRRQRIGGGKTRRKDER